MNHYLDKEFKIDFSFFPSVENIRRFSQLGRTIIELFYPFQKKLGFETELCIGEALNNVLLHAQDENKDKISFQIKGKKGNLFIRIFDNGDGFSLQDHLSKELDLYQTNGRGLFLMKNLTDNLKYIRGKTRNQLIMKKTVASRDSKK